MGGRSGGGGLGRGLRRERYWRRGLRERGVLGAEPEGRGELGLGLKNLEERERGKSKQGGVVGNWCGAFAD